MQRTAGALDEPFHFILREDRWQANRSFREWHVLNHPRALECKKNRNAESCWATLMASSLRSVKRRAWYCRMCSGRSRSGDFEVLSELLNGTEVNADSNLQ